MKQPQLPQDGDILVSNPTATVEHEISIVPRRPHITCANHDQGVAEGRQLAKELEVNAWLTEDNRHFMLVGTYRQ